MIQRIQSLYLLISTAAYICLFFFPFAGFWSEGKYFELSVLGVTQDGMLNSRAVFLLAGVITLALMSFSIIFFYKKRMLQSRLTAVTLLLNVALIAGMFLYSDNFSEANIRLQYKTGTYLVLVPLLFLWLANRAIRSDEMKVRSSDRLR